MEVKSFEFRMWHLAISCDQYCRRTRYHAPIIPIAYEIPYGNTLKPDEHVDGGSNPTKWPKQFIGSLKRRNENAKAFHDKCETAIRK
jgi:hypothetical protein